LGLTFTVSFFSTQKHNPNFLHSVSDSYILHLPSHEFPFQTQCFSTQSFEEVNTEQLFTHSSTRRTHSLSELQEEDDLFQHYKKKNLKKKKKRPFQTTSFGQVFCNWLTSVCLLELQQSLLPREVVEHTDEERIPLKALLKQGIVNTLISSPK
jgi:hypothetical protein